MKACNYIYINTWFFSVTGHFFYTKSYVVRNGLNDR